MSRILDVVQRDWNSIQSIQLFFFSIIIVNFSVILFLSPTCRMWASKALRTCPCTSIMARTGLCSWNCSSVHFGTGVLTCSLFGSPRISLRSSVSSVLSRATFSSSSASPLSLRMSLLGFAIALRRWFLRIRFLTMLMVDKHAAQVLDQFGIFFFFLYPPSLPLHHSLSFRLVFCTWRILWPRLRFPFCHSCFCSYSSCRWCYHLGGVHNV